MEILTSARGQKNLPRYFRAVLSTLERLENGRLDIHLPDGRIFRRQAATPGPAARLDVHNSDCFTRLIRDGSIGFSEAYMDGWWSTPDLQTFMDLVMTSNNRVYDGFPGMGVVRAYERFLFWLKRNYRGQARKNISYHYDLGNDFFAAWLDETMTYSSAVFATGQEDLAKAQTAKYAAIVDQMGVSAGDHVLEIGCGWGGFAEYAAGTRGLRVTALTISREQHDFAVARIKNAGLSGQVEISLRDYRDETGTYDGIASIEMFEAVGEKYWPAYFETLHNRLKRGAQATLQIITTPDDRFKAYRKRVDFIRKYIFPGGMLPSPGVLQAQVARAGLTHVRTQEYSDSYDQTLRRWYETFNAAWGDIEKMGFDSRFRRMWNFYLTSSASSFSGRNCDLIQITVARPA